MSESSAPKAPSTYYAPADLQKFGQIAQGNPALAAAGTTAPITASVVCPGDAG